MEVVGAAGGTVAGEVPKIIYERGDVKLIRKAHRGAELFDAQGAAGDLTVAVARAVLKIALQTPRGKEVGVKGERPAIEIGSLELRIG